MRQLPKEIKLSRHAKQRLNERQSKNIIYNEENIMLTKCNWYSKADLIENSGLYQHSLYICRKNKDQLDYVTNGEIEVLYNKGTGVALTIMEIKEKFLPVTQYIKPDISD